MPVANDSFLRSFSNATDLHFEGSGANSCLNDALNFIPSWICEAAHRHLHNDGDLGVG